MQFVFFVVAPFFHDNGGVQLWPAAMSATPGLLIDPLRLRDLLGETCVRFAVDSIADCESTNTLLLARVEQGAPAGSVIVADHQSAGRGSRGRRWIAAPHASLTFSVLWRFPGSTERLAGLSLAVGVAAVRALEACAARGIMLKWPNDILHGDAKLGGILVEIQTDPQADRGGALAVIGIGINLSLPPNIDGGERFAIAPAALDGILFPPPERNVLLAQLLIALADVFDRFAAGGFAALRDGWQARHAWQDRPVRVLRNGRVENEGICRGADSDGALLLQTAAGIERCLSGDVSLRSA